MTRLGRRTVLSGAAAALLAPRRARASDDALAKALDAAAADPDPARALRALTGFDAAQLQPGARRDLLAARAGLAVDAQIRSDFGIDPRSKGPLPHDPSLAALLLRRKLGDRPGPAEAKARLDAEIARCEGKAAILFNRLGVQGATTGARFSALWRDARFLYDDDDAGRDRAVADMNRQLARLRTMLVPHFGPVPPWCLNVRTRRASAEAKPGTRALPDPDTAGFYTVDLDRIEHRPAWTLPSVVAHELLPGHMLQMPMEALAAPHALRLEYAQGFIEGWGIFAERAVAAAGLYQGDAHAELGYLHWRLFRLGRARADIGIHIGGMSQDEARAALVRAQGEPAYFAPFDTDLARIVKDPMSRAAECLMALALEDARRTPRRTPFLYDLLRYGRVRSDMLDSRILR